ncbi:MAG TPA: ABC transporter substrate-binding protein [Abditibacterium sp.]|jgi:peptide/nickel transport system substrate-binding protein
MKPNSVLRLLPFLPMLALAGCGGQEKFANSNVAVSDASRTDKDLADAQLGKITEPPSKPGKYGGKITEATAGDPKTFNLWVSADASSSGAVSPLYSALLERNAYTLEWEGALAELPKISADGLTWTFQLKPDLKWSDGAPITADDVIFTLDVIYDPKVQTNFAESMKVDVPDGKGGFKRVPVGYKKIDARTVEFKFPVQYAPARDILSFAVAPRHKLFKAWNQGQPKATAFNPAYGPNVDVKELVASGPWVLTQYVQGQRLVYGRNPNYWKKDEQGRSLPYLDQQVTLIVPDFNTTTLKFLSGETDVLGVQQTDYKTVKEQEQKGNFTVRNLGPTFSTSYLGFNMNMRSKPAKANPELFKLFNDVRFRQAVSHAVDREKIARNVFGGLAQPGYGPDSPANKLFFSPDVPKFEFNLDSARKKLAEIGLKDGNGDGILELPDGKPVKFNIITNVENKLRVGQATTIVADLKKIGIDASFTPIQFSALISRVDNKPEPGKPYPPFDWQAMLLGFTGGVEPNNGASIWKSSGNLHQWEPYQEKPVRPWEAEIDRLFREGAQEMDETKRKAIYAQFQKIVGEQQPFIYTVVPDSISALRNKFGNVKPSATGGVTWNVDEMYDLSATRDQP